MKTTRINRAAVAGIALLVAASSLVGCAPASPVDGTVSTTSTTTTPTTSTTIPAPGPIANGNLLRTSNITASQLNGSVYRFSFTVKNVGPAACIQDLVVVLHRTAPSWLVNDQVESSICLDPNESHTITKDADLGVGHWYFSAQWHDEAGYHFFQDAAPVEYQVDTTPPVRPGITDHISGGTWQVRQTINGAVVGSLGAGRTVVIDCQTVGSPVTVAGFGTSTIYDHITEPVSGWVSDLAMSTTPYGVRDPRLPACAGTETPPAAVTPAAQSAANWAIAEKNSPNPRWSDQLHRSWSGMCEAFAEIAYGTRGRFGSALDHYRFRLGRGQIHTDANPPVGAFVFYGGGGGYGHIGISIGNGQVISTQGFDGQNLPVWQTGVTALTNPYLGWAAFDGAWG